MPNSVPAFFSSPGEVKALDGALRLAGITTRILAIKGRRSPLIFEASRPLSDEDLTLAAALVVEMEQSRAIRSAFFAHLLLDERAVLFDADGKITAVAGNAPVPFHL